MKLFTCLKEVPGKDARYDVDRQKHWLDESRVTFEINECDEYALEESLKLKEKHGGEVTILTIGSARAEKVMRKGLAMGADRGILVQDDEKRLDSPFAFASTLAEVLKQEEFDLILAGTQSDDFSYAQTGVMLAELLGLPHATIVMEIEADPSARTVKALREMESGWFQWVEMPQPAVLTVQAGISPIRYPSLKGIMQAKKKEIRKLMLDDLALQIESMPRLEVLELYFPAQDRKAELLQGTTDEIVARLVEKLKREVRVSSRSQ